MRSTLAPLLAAVLLSGCGGSGNGSAGPTATPTPTVPPSLTLPADQPPRDPYLTLALVPASAEAVTITDYDAIRARLGLPDLTSDDLMTDRTALWERAQQEAVLLNVGVLREENSLFMLDYGFTQDDVDFETRWSGPDGAGFVIGFRPDQDMAEVQAAVKDGAGPLEGAEVMAEEHLVVRGVADPGALVWASTAGLSDLTDEAAESTYFSKACLPVREALGPDATFEDQDALVSRLDPTYLRPLEAWSVTFTGDVVTARLGVDRIDLHQRANLVELWPTTGSIGVEDAFAGSPVADPGTGRLGLQVRNPVAAATLTLTGQLPFAVCNEVLPFEEPTGL